MKTREGLAAETDQIPDFGTLATEAESSGLSLKHCGALLAMRKSNKPYITRLTYRPISPILAWYEKKPTILLAKRKHNKRE